MYKPTNLRRVKASLPIREITNPFQAVRLIGWHGVNCWQKEYWAICLDKDSRLLGITRVTHGAAIESSEIKRLVEAAVILQASKVILLHNIFSPSPIPWESDIRDTISVKGALGSMEIILLDHIIVSFREYFSMAAQRTYSNV